MSSATRRIINVANRLPVKITAAGDGIKYAASEGGLATGLSALFRRYDSLWIGWPGAVVKEDQQAQVTADLAERKLAPVFLSSGKLTSITRASATRPSGRCFIISPRSAASRQKILETYQEVNRRFADAVIAAATPDDMIWIHDYQLMLVPQMVRAAMPEATIGYFLHIPFPAYPIFMALPWRKEILEGLMGANVIGFQTYDDVHHFTDAANRILDINFVGNEVKVEERTVVAQAFPISIDYHRFHNLAQSPALAEDETSLHNLLGGRKLAISVDRLDYSKGIIQRLRAYELFLEQHPEWHGKVGYLHLVVPSRDTVRNYRELKEEMDRTISAINGSMPTFRGSPSATSTRA